MVAIKNDKLYRAQDIYIYIGVSSQPQFSFATFNSLLTGLSKIEYTLYTIQCMLLCPNIPQATLKQFIKADNRRQELTVLIYLDTLVKLRHYEKATKLEKKSPTCFDKTDVFTQQHQNKWDIFSNLCALLRKVKLY